MGGTSSSSQTQTSQTSPYSAASPALTSALQNFGVLANTAGSLTPAQNNAINTIEANASAGNPFAGAIGNATTGLLNGGGAQANDTAIKANLGDYRAALQPYANGAMIGQNTALQPALDAQLAKVTNQVNSQFAAANRDGSGMNLKALGDGWGAAAAPIVAAQYNTDVQNMLNANAALYGAGNSTYGLLNQNQQNANTNAQAGATLAPAALDAGNWQANTILQAEAQRSGIPLQNLTTILGAVSPVAQMFGMQNGTTNGSQTMSGAQQFGTIAQGIGNIASAFNPGGVNAYNPWTAKK